MSKFIELGKDFNKSVMNKGMIRLLRLVLVASLKNTSTKFVNIFRNIIPVLLKGIQNDTAIIKMRFYSNAEIKKHVLKTWIIE